MCPESKPNKISGSMAVLKSKVTEIRGHEKHIKRKLLISTGLSMGIFVSNWVGVPAFALSESELIYMHLPGALNRGLILGLTYGVNMLASVTNMIQEGRLLKNPRIELSQNPISTLAYHGL